MAGWSVLEVMKTIDPQIKELEESITKRNAKRQNRKFRNQKIRIKISKATREAVKKTLYFLKKIGAEKPALNLYEDGGAYISSIAPQGVLEICFDSNGVCDDFQMYPGELGKIPYEALLGALI